MAHREYVKKITNSPVDAPDHFPTMLLPNRVPKVGVPVVADPNNRRPAKPIGLGLAVIGSELVAFALAGIAIDYFAGTRGAFTVAALALGMLAAVALTVRLLRDESRSVGP